MLRRHALGLAAAGPVLVGKALTRLGLKKPPEAWRSLLGSALRGEPSKFALSAFGLRVRAAELPARFDSLSYFVPNRRSPASPRPGTM